MKETFFFLNTEHIYYMFKALKWEKNQVENILIELLSTLFSVQCLFFPLHFFNLPSASNEHVT